MQHPGSPARPHAGTVARRFLVALTFLGMVGTGAAGQSDLVLDPGMPKLRALIERFTEDQRGLDRRYPLTLSPDGHDRRRRFLEEWAARLDALDFESLGREDRIDWILLANHVARLSAEEEEVARRDAEASERLPFAASLVALFEARFDQLPVSSEAAAATLDEVRGEVEREISALEAGTVHAEAAVARRALLRLRSLRSDLDEWFQHFDGYDPNFTWWVAAPYRALLPKLERHAELLEQLAGMVDEHALVGDPIGRDALCEALRHEFVPYSPEELVDIALREFAWCEEERREASAELGFGDDWRAALDHVKGLHVAPGEQPDRIRRLALEATEYVESRDLVTVPDLCKELWRAEMMSPERQRVNPYFTGGEVISISYPTAEMSFADKLMSMRGNNEHFSRAVVHHELIPGHHLQLYSMARHRAHRQIFDTPFWLEGWALYWEMRLWDLGFPHGPEDRLGMLFWRSHRCARIVFSLDFHLGRRTGPECVDFLVERVGHERRNAEAEVRRSIAGDYSPLYQAGYMLGGLQILALHRELVEERGITEREFHDAVLHENSIPIAIVRLDLLGGEVPRDGGAPWRFADR